MPKQSPTRRFGDRFATIVPNDDGDCFAKTARNDTGLNGYLLDSLHDAQILAIKQDGRRVIIQINYVAE